MSREDLMCVLLGIVVGAAWVYWGHLQTSQGMIAGAATAAVLLLGAAAYDRSKR